MSSRHLQTELCVPLLASPPCSGPAARGRRGERRLRGPALLGEVLSRPPVTVVGLQGFLPFFFSDVLYQTEEVSIYYFAEFFFKTMKEC